VGEDVAVAVVVALQQQQQQVGAQCRCNLCKPKCCLLFFCLCP
jgi:hypothetical protein